jgi:hypothetical protein
MIQIIVCRHGRAVRRAVVPITCRSASALADDLDACGAQQPGEFSPGVSFEQGEGLACRPGRVPGQLTGPDGTAALIDQLRASGTVLTYDPHDRTLRVGGRDALSVTIGKDH